MTPIPSRAIQPEILEQRSEEIGRSDPHEEGNSGPVQFSRDLIASMPDELVHQIMAWLAQTDPSEATLDTLAATSNTLAAIAQDFRKSAAYLAQKYHQNAVAVSVEYINRFPRRLAALSSADADELRAKLAPRVDGSVLRAQIRVMDDAGAALVYECLPDFRNYSGRALSVTTSARPNECAAILGIAGALPAEACLELIFRDVEGRSAEVAGLIRQVASLGRMSGLIFLHGPDLVSDATALATALDVACDPGRVNHIRFNQLEDPGPTLKALASRCRDFHAVRLVVLRSDTGPEKDDLDALAAALQQRQTDGKSRITVVFHNDHWVDSDYADTPVAAPEQRAELEKLGLFFGPVWGGQERIGAFADQLAESVREGPMARWRPNSE